MKKIAYLFGLILIFSLPEILSAQLPRGVRVPAGENTGGGQVGQSNPDNDCDITYTFTVGVFNLDLINGLNFGNSNENSSLSLPDNDSYPPMQISYQIGNTSEIIEVNEFSYLATPPDHPAPYMFVFNATITVNVAGLCNGNDSSNSIPFQLTYALETVDGSPYPVCDYMQEGDLFDCSYYDCSNTGNGIGPTPCNENEELTSATESFRCGDCTGYKIARARTDFQPSNSENASDESSKNKLAIEVMPNPFDTYLQIKWGEKTINPLIRIFDASGRLIKVWTDKPYDESEIFYEDLSDLSKGIYFLHVQNGKDSIYKKLIKS